MASWTCGACTLVNAARGAACAACGAAFAEAGQRCPCPLCTFDNPLDAERCEICDAALDAKTAPNEPKRGPGGAKVLFYTATASKRKLLEVAGMGVVSNQSVGAEHRQRHSPEPEACADESGNELGKQTDSDDMVDEGDEGVDDSSGCSVYTISDSDEFEIEGGDSRPLQDGDPDEIEEFVSDYERFSAPPAPLPAGMAEVAPVLPHISRHFWSVKQLTTLKVCAVNFNEFTLDAASNPNCALSTAKPRTTRGKNDYEQRRKLREQKERKTKHKSSRKRGTRKVARSRKGSGQR